MSCVIKFARSWGSLPPKIRAMLNSDRLPQTRQMSCGLSLTTSHSAHRTAFCRGTLLRTRGRWAETPPEPFITAPRENLTLILLIPCSSTSPRSRSQTPASLAIDGFAEHAIDPFHDPIGPLHSGRDQRLGPRAWPAVLQIFGAFQMTCDQYPGDDA